MSDFLQWPPGTVRADMPSHPIAVGQREGPHPDPVAGHIDADVPCSSAANGKHTLVNAEPADNIVKHTDIDDRPINITTKLCQTCSRWGHFREAS